MTSEIDESKNIQDFDEAKIKASQDNNEPESSSTPIADQAVKQYKFDKTTIIIGLQILPTNSEVTKKVLISAGIIGEPPVMNSTTLTEIEQVPAIAEILTKLKQNLPQIAASAQQRQLQQHKLQTRQQKQTIPLPELPLATSIPPKSSNQLSLL